jgi:predicted negative regulator of RcsB-dependent stress response
MDNGRQVTAKRINKVRSVVRYSVAITASLLLIIVCIVGFNFYRLSSDKLFAEKYTAYDLTTTPAENEHPESKIEKAYRQKNYAEVIKLNATSVLSVKDIFLTAMSFLETNDPSRAISNFQIVMADVKDDKNSALKDVTEYYLALAYLKNNDYDQAIELMDSIRENSSHQYKSKFSRKYINKIKRLKWR